MVDFLFKHLVNELVDMLTEADWDEEEEIPKRKKLQIYMEETLNINWLIEISAVNVMDQTNQYILTR